MRRVALGLLTTGVLLVPVSIADARAPVLNSVSVEAGHGIAVWTLPDGVESRFVEAATRPTTNEDGYFLQRNVEAEFFNVLASSDTHFDFALKPGTHYIHISGEDRRHRSCPVREFSSIFRFTVAGGTITAVDDVGGGSPACPAGSGGGGGGTGGGGGGGGRGGRGDRVFRSLIARRVQDIDRLYVVARLSEAGSVTAAATVTISGAAKVYRFRSVTRKVAANVRRKLRLKLSRRNLRAVKRALRRGKRLRARIKVTARGSGGDVGVRRKSVRLRP